jgi:RNA polymerase primary sigma factor
MASKASAMGEERNEARENQSVAPPDARPLLDLSDAALKKLIRIARQRGYVTHQQVGSVAEEVSSEQIENVLAMFSEMGVNVVETEEVADQEETEREQTDDEAEAERSDLDEVTQKVPARSDAKEPADRTDDPVRMYLRAMGSIQLLSRQGEIVIAKRIEAGREAMIAGLCESPLTFQAIIIWRDELNEGKVFLRDIIDLEATYAGPDARAMPSPPVGPAGRLLAAAAGAAITSPQAPPVAPVTATLFKPASDGSGEDEGKLGGAAEREIDDDDMEDSLSLAAIEQELKPRVVETFDHVADTYKRLRRLQDLRNGSLSAAQERRYKKLKEEIIADVKSLRLNQARIDTLVEQLYEINKRLVGCEGRLMRLAESHDVAREDFLEHYRGSELDPLWLDRVCKLSAKGWKSFVANDRDKVEAHRTDIHALATETGLEIGEFRKIVHMVQRDRVS